MSTVKLFNKGKRTIHGHHAGIIDPVTGLAKPYSFAAQQSAEFDEAEADKLRRLFKSEIVSMDDVKRQFDTAPAPSLEDPNAGKFDKDQVSEMIKQAVADAIEAERARAADEAEESEGEDTDEGGTDPEAEAAKAVEKAEKKRAEKEAAKAAKEAAKAAK